MKPEQLKQIEGHNPGPFTESGPTTHPKPFCYQVEWQPLTHGKPFGTPSVVALFTSMADAQHFTKACNNYERLLQERERLLEALQQFLNIYPEKVRQHPDIKIACQNALAAIAFAEE